MPLRSYGVLKGKAIEVRLGAGSSPHYEVRLIDDTTDYRIAINVKSQLPPSDVEFLVVDRFEHPITALLEALPKGYSQLKAQPGTAAIDFIRGNLFDRSTMRPLPFSVPGFDNDLNEKLDAVMQRAMGDETALVYAFGERWGPEPGVKDKYFGFLPGNGIHDIHMNQGNSGQFVGDDGVYQDGAVLVHFPGQHQWTAIFLKFQSQAWHTDDRTGHRLATPAPQPPVPQPPAPQPPVPQPPAPVPAPVPPSPPPPLPPGPPTSDEPDGLVRIVGALVNSTRSPEVEIVTLLNTAPHDIALAGWALLDAQKRRMPLTGVLPAGATLAVRAAAPLALSNKGGAITLVDDQGLKVHGVAYTKEQARHPGWTLVF